MRRTTLLLAVLLAFAACDTPTAPPVRDASLVAHADVVEPMHPIGIRFWYTGDRYFEVAAADFAATIPTLPPSGWLIAMVYLDQEYVPGKPYRMVLMSDACFIYNPLRTDAWMFESTQETKNAARARLGDQITYFTGASAEPSNYMDIIMAAMNARTWP